MPKAAPYRVIWDPGRGSYELHDTSSQQALSVVPGSREWFDWLRSASSFTFGGQHAQLTVRQESRSPGQEAEHIGTPIGETDTTRPRNTWVGPAISPLRT